MTNKNFVGSVFMVAGCAMGAGCLAMPMLAAGPNFIFSSIFLILVGFFSYFIAMVSLELFLVYKGNTNISTIAKRNFGNSGVIVAGVINIALMYALLSVYMTGGSDLLSKTILPLVHLNDSFSTSLLLFLILALIIFFNGAEIVVKSNKFVFTIKLISFIVAVIIGLKFISPAIFAIVVDQFKYIPKAVPVFFGALWFHFLIPIVARLNNYERPKIRQIFSIGLLLPVVLYILWVGIMLSLVPRSGSGNTFFYLLVHNDSLGTMIKYATTNNPNLPGIMKVALNLFSNVAMLTSFLTVGISTYDYLRDAFKIKQHTIGIIINALITLIPPAIFASFLPNGFVFILDQAIILLSLINLFMLTCCLKEYSSLSYKPHKTLIYSLIILLVGLITLQVCDNVGMLPSFGIN